MRGSLHDDMFHHAVIGIIPAHAGLTCGVSWNRSCTRDHPRACGAHPMIAEMPVAVMGSSPRMRGSPCTITLSRIHYGIIPAHAGLTHISAAWSKLPWDHPRACGAHRSRTTVLQTSLGSSPRMRGSPRRNIPLIEQIGIIPAHAGLTLHQDCGSGRYEDHPRACGAHKQIEATGDPELGSSPRMRGSLMKQAVERRLLGITPAHAGLTGRSTALIPAAKDHPRACGAHLNVSPIMPTFVGSSPRMRGSPS